MNVIVLLCNEDAIDAWAIRAESLTSALAFENAQNIKGENSNMKGSKERPAIMHTEEYKLNPHASWAISPFSSLKIFLKLSTIVIRSAHVCPKPFIIAEVPENSINKSVKLQDKDILVGINGNPIKYFDEAENLLKEFAGKEISISIKREEEIKTLDIKVSDQGKLEVLTYGLGLSDLEKLGYYDLANKNYSFLQAIPAGTKKSYETLDVMVKHVTEILRDLELPFRILKLCGGDMSFTSALTYDMEVYSAAQERWLEVSSVSNFETFQSNRLKLRYKDSDNKTVSYAKRKCTCLT